MSGEGAAEEVDDERAAFIADVRRYKRLLRDRLQSLRDLQEEFEKLGYQNEIAVLGAGIDGTLIKYLSEYVIGDSVVPNAADDFACVLLGSKGQRQGSEKLKKACPINLSINYISVYLFTLFFNIIFIHLKIVTPGRQRKMRVLIRSEDASEKRTWLRQRQVPSVEKNLQTVTTPRSSTTCAMQLRVCTPSSFGTPLVSCTQTFANRRHRCRHVRLFQTLVRF